MKNLRRRGTSFEYETVRARAEELGFRGYGQLPSSASGAFTPEIVRKKTVKESERAKNRGITT